MNESYELRCSARKLGYRHLVYRGGPKYCRRILRGAIKIFVQEPLPQIQHYHPDMMVQQWRIQVDHLHVALVIPLQYAVSSIGGKMKATG